MRRLLLIPVEIAARLQRDLLLLILVLLCIGLSVLDPAAIASYPQLVDWPTIAALAGLLLLTTGLEESGFLQHLAFHLITRMHSERHLALLLVIVSAMLASVLTNDIALFIVVPLTLGLTVLLNQHVVRERRGSRVVIAGVTDYSAERFGAEHRSDPAGALHGAPADAGVKLLLAHQPRSASAAAAAGFDLQLSGHTHGGQFLPWNFFVRLQQPFVSGLNRLGRLWVYTSRGTGYWGPPKRLGAPSEITLLRLRPAAP